MDEVKIDKKIDKFPAYALFFNLYSTIQYVVDDTGHRKGQKENRCENRHMHGDSIDFQIEFLWVLVFLGVSGAGFGCFFGGKGGINKE